MTQTKVTIQLTQLLNAINTLDDACRDDCKDFTRSIAKDLLNFEEILIHKLEKAGWTVSYLNDKIENNFQHNVYPPDSPTGTKIRQFRENIIKK